MCYGRQNEGYQLLLTKEFKVSVFTLVNTTSFTITPSFLKFELADEVDLGDHLFSGWIYESQHFGTWSRVVVFTVNELIKTITKFLNVIGYHQPDLSTNRTVYASCL